MPNTYAKPQAAGAFDIEQYISSLVDYELSSNVIASDEIFQLLHIVASTLPANPTKIDGVRDAKVVKGSEQLPVNRIRQTDLCGNAVAEKAKYVEVIHSL